MKELFEISGGSIIGRDHRLAGKSNQDAYLWLTDDEVIVALICDGCSSGKHSEVGAKIGASLLAKEIIEQWRRNLMSKTGSPKAWSGFLEQVRQNVLSQIRILAKAMAGDFVDVIFDWFLFSALGFVVTPEETVLFSAGDGVFAVNGKLSKIGPFPSNAPPYLCYELVKFSLAEFDFKMLRFQVNIFCPTKDISSLFIGSDGLADLLDIAEKQMPGKKELVGPVSQFWEEDRYFKNPDMIRRKLAMTNNEFIRPKWEEQELEKKGGLLKDDTTLIVFRTRVGKRGEIDGSIY